MPVCERLQAGELVAEVAVEIGGALAAFYREERADRPRHDWLRPAAAAALEAHSPLGMASFPLVPWCNPIRAGRFTWNGRTVELAPNYGESPHTIHGLGWQRAWSVVERDAASLVLSCSERGDGAWPFPFEATQRYAVDPVGLSIEVELRNTGTGSMPAGIGHHPYFPHRREGTGTRVQAQVDAIWLSDDEAMPTRLSRDHPSVAALRRGMAIADHRLDNNFIGFGHRATIDWPDGSALTVAAEPPLDCFVLYTPASEDFFVLEAVSNCTDWINLVESGKASPTDVGGAALAPGQALRASTRFEPREPSRVAEGAA
jgi:aldose 1-epimerase